MAYIYIILKNRQKSEKVPILVGILSATQRFFLIFLLI